MLKIDPDKVSTQQIGRMGELIVELELLSRGWQVGNFNDSTTNSVGWDIFAAKPGRSAKIRVKAKRPGTDCFRWSAKADGSVLLGLERDDATDFVAAVSFSLDGGYEVYVVPSEVVETTLQSNHVAYIAAPKRDGDARKDTTQRNLFLNYRVDGPVGHGFRRHWSQYRNAWERLEN